MKKAVKIRILSLITALSVAVFTVGYAFAWIINHRDADFNINGESAGAYFAGGDGTKGNEFIITNRTHMYNLAWLQNTGRLSDRKYYFKVGNSFDMGDMKLPPIGNDEYPFGHDFNGNGCTISNLQVTTNKDELTAFAASKDTYEFSNAVGMFGMTNADSAVYNFILANPNINVSSVNTLYSTAAGGKKTELTDGGVVTASAKSAGIAVGYVNGRCQSIGIKATDSGAALNIDVAGYSSFNSILGELNDNVQSSVTGGGHAAGTGGSGSSFGANFDMASVSERLKTIYRYKYGVEYKQGNTETPLANSSPLLPQIDTANSEPVPAAGAKIAFSADVENSTYEGPTAAEVISDNNVGYFLGNENKFGSKNFTYKDKMTKPQSDNGYIDWRTAAGISGTHVPSWFYTYDTKIANRSGNGCYTNDTFRPLTDEEFGDLPDSIKSMLPGVGVQKQFTTIRISQGGVGTGNWGDITNKQQWSYHGQISWMGNTYGRGFNSADGKAVDKNGNVIPADEVVYDEEGNWISGDYYIGSGVQTQGFNYYTGGIALPNNAIWFKPSQVGKIRFVMYSQSDGDGFILDKITRNSASKQEPFRVDPTKNGTDVTTEIIFQQNLPEGVLFYFDYDVSQTEIDAGNVEFILQKHGNHGAHFVYLDIGASAAEDVSDVVDEKVSAVDFIYDGVEIEQDAASGLGVGNFIIPASGSTAATKYEASKTSVYFEGLQNAITLVFIRLHNDSTGNHSGKTICLEKSTPSLDEVYATNKDYVCPTVKG